MDKRSKYLLRVEYGEHDEVISLTEDQDRLFKWLDKKGYICDGVILIPIDEFQIETI